ncbi:unknow [Vibrio parahaemolyticus]|nr:unknow [Vibrio parahaemolyticus]
MRLISVLKCHAETWSLRASPLNWALCESPNLVSASIKLLY